MARKFTLESLDYDVDDLTEDGQKIWSRMLFALQKLDELSGQHALLTRAKNAYIEDIKNEVVQSKSGVDFAALFSDD
ncbi:MAG TPA: hypothetical protein DCL66_14470 [Gammaproteobacteria bacterium]|nr:hypothetical protein [Gammaproteobacteria bacterium]